MQVREPGRPITNLEAAALLYAARERRSARFPPPKEVAVREVQTLFYLTKDGGFTRRDTSKEAVATQGTHVARLVQLGVDGEAALQLANMPVTLASEAKLFMVLPQAEETLGAEGVQRVTQVLDEMRTATLAEGFVNR